LAVVLFVRPRVEFSKTTLEADRKVGVTKKTSMLLNDFPKREERPRTNVVSVSDVDSVVDDFFKSAPVGESNEKGTVKQLVASLRTSTRFSKMRVNRESTHHHTYTLVSLLLFPSPLALSLCHPLGLLLNGTGLHVCVVQHDTRSPCRSRRSRSS
jgi:hypothetical protein